MVQMWPGAFVFFLFPGCSAACFHFKHCKFLWRGFTQGLVLFAGSELVRAPVRCFSLLNASESALCRGAVVVVFGVGGVCVCCGGGLCCRSSLTELNTLCSRGSVIPDAALFASKGCSNLHKEF